MTKYAALLRGISPTYPAMRNENLRGVLEELGFMHVQSVISSGNVVFESPRKDVAGLEADIEAAWPRKLGFTSTTIVRSQHELQELWARQPFAGYAHSPKTSLDVTFLKHRQGVAVKPPEGTGYKVVAAYPGEVCSVIDITSAKTPDFMLKAERTYGKEITTRTWKTVERILAKLGAS